MKIERPLDFLDSQKGKTVLVYCKDKSHSGTLLAFDIHINLVIETPDTILFIRGDDVKSVEELR